MAHIIGSRIMLREYRKEDLPAIRKWVNNYEITKNLSDAFLYPMTIEATEKRLNGKLEGKPDMQGFVIADKETEEYLGQVDLFSIDWKNRNAILGIVLAVTSDQNKGYGTESIKLMLNFAFQQMNLYRIQLHVNPKNAIAIHCYEKCGFQHEGRLRSHRFTEGEYGDDLIMGILRHEFLELNK
ncbi:GNAT family N-acetyltransferase [Paenibacillus sp. N1-5-1-14]|uniref:GNAT family N-acetyltransferase n=1 Tax=Paenibacillus radicibacter TaxID=2972488 RepID=UPI0021595D5F|nr:GNAT family protein [Paenibacillus radicibacter]MCR8644454.1 GNAT family N-acetyltransferase [Paenibacillus radicibacter]